MKNQVRAFLAVDLSEAVRSNVAKLIRSLQPRIDGTKWVETQNLHVTLKFLGDVPLTELHHLIAAVTRGAQATEAFDLEFLGCGAFPNLESPKTIWVGCDRGAEELTRLAGSIEEELFQCGYPKENRRFSPHLTIGRVKRGASTDVSLTEFFRQQQGRPFGSCGIDQVALYSSELTRRGPIYDELAVIPLR